MATAKTSFQWHISCSLTVGMKPALLALLCLLLSACSAVVPSQPEVYRIGELEVRLYKDQGRMTQDLPLVLSTVQALRVGGQPMKVLGYFDRPKKRIYSMDDPRVLLHELKHYLEPEWNHDIGCGHLTTADEHVASPCDNKPLAESASAQPAYLRTEPALAQHVSIDNDVGF
jgi:hypothetical protein